MSGLTPCVSTCLVYTARTMAWHTPGACPSLRIPAQLLSGPRPLYIVTHITSQCPHHNHRNQPHHFPRVIKLSPCNKDYHSKWSDLNNLWMTWQHYWVTCLCYECFEPRYAVTAMCHMFIFPSHFILFICPIIYSYKDFEGYISDMKTGNMGLNVCGAHLSPSLPPHMILLWSHFTLRNLHPRPPWPPPPRAQVKLLITLLPRLPGHNKNLRNSHKLSTNNNRAGCV